MATPGEVSELFHLIRREDFKRAAKLAPRLVAAHPADGDLWAAHVFLLVHQSRFAECIDAVKRAPAEFRGQLVFYNAYSLYRLNRLEDLLAETEKPTAARDERLRTLRAQALYRLGRYAEACDAYATLVEPRLDSATGAPPEDDPETAELIANLLAADTFARAACESASGPAVATSTAAVVARLTRGDSAPRLSFEGRYNQGVAEVDSGALLSALTHTRAALASARRALRDDGATPTEIDSETALLQTQAALLAARLGFAGDAAAALRAAATASIAANDAVASGVARVASTAVRPGRDVFDALRAIKVLTTTTTASAAVSSESAGSAAAAGVVGGGGTVPGVTSSSATAAAAAATTHGQRAALRLSKASLFVASGRFDDAVRAIPPGAATSATAILARAAQAAATAAASAAATAASSATSQSAATTRKRSRTTRGGGLSQSIAVLTSASSSSSAPSSSRRGAAGPSAGAQASSAAASILGSLGLDGITRIAASAELAAGGRAFSVAHPTIVAAAVAPLLEAAISEASASAQGVARLNASLANGPAGFGPGAHVSTAMDPAIMDGGAVTTALLLAQLRLSAGDARGAIAALNAIAGAVTVSALASKAGPVPLPAILAARLRCARSAVTMAAAIEAKDDSSKVTDAIVLWKEQTDAAHAAVESAQAAIDSLLPATSKGARVVPAEADLATALAVWAALTTHRLATAATVPASVGLGCGFAEAGAEASRAAAWASSLARRLASAHAPQHVVDAAASAAISFACLATDAATSAWASATANPSDAFSLAAAPTLRSEAVAVANAVCSSERSHGRLEAAADASERWRRGEIDVEALESMGIPDDRTLDGESVTVPASATSISGSVAASGAGAGAVASGAGERPHDDDPDDDEDDEDADDFDEAAAEAAARGLIAGSSGAAGSAGTASSSGPGRRGTRSGPRPTVVRRRSRLKLQLLDKLRAEYSKIGLPVPQPKPDRWLPVPLRGLRGRKLVRVLQSRDDRSSQGAGKLAGTDLRLDVRAKQEKAAAAASGGPATSSTPSSAGTPAAAPPSGKSGSKGSAPAPAPAPAPSPAKGKTGSGSKRH